MEINDLIRKYSDTRQHQEQGIFSSLFIISNSLQTLFDNHIDQLSLKQFMLLSIIRNSQEALTFTQLGSLLGCSRQNIKKLARILEEKGFIEIMVNPADKRALCAKASKKTDEYWNNDFLKHQDELRFLFEIYSDKELEVFFQLLMKLYAGVDNLEEKISDEKIY